ncbi:RecA [Achromobacter phage Motura]|uniref:RecA n=1 Tax=Achromobacter phage Motura TaxID=2591403 RepID=A0A514CSK1_9CAUD|nr:RecA [Achromobacter phage Motura]QDH83446.1 RecA [Achromobacter phage Motura]
MAKKEKDAKAKKTKVKADDKELKKAKKAVKAVIDDAEKKTKKALKAAKAKKSKSRSDDDEVDDDGDEASGEAGFDPYAHMNSDLDEIERQVQVTSGLEEDAFPMSTGLLMKDLMLGGGIRPGMYTTAGGEQSTKTTSVINDFAAATLAGVPIKSWWDYEGSTVNSHPYVESIMRANGIKKTARDLFGVRDSATGKYIVTPIIRFQTESILEKFFDYFHGMLKRLPNKRLLAGKWWYIYEDSKENQKKYGEFASKKMPKMYGKGIYIPVPNDDGSLQAVVGVDSYPAMNPLLNDEDEANEGLALNARRFSKLLPRVKGLLVQKRVALLGVNQLRDIPMARYGPTQMEPGGKALQFNSDVRLWNSSRALSGVPYGNPKGEGKFEFEDSITGEGKDRYRYIHQKMVKNKLSQEIPEVWYRLWVEDVNGEAQGYDPVWDTIYYLFVTGQVSGKRHAMTLNLEKLGAAKKSTSWKELKLWVLGSKDDKKKISERLGYKPMDLRKFCFSQMKKGTSKELYFAQQNKNAKNKDSSDDSED